MRDYSISEEVANDIRAQLDKRKAPQPKLTSFYQTDKLASLVGAGFNINNDSDLDFSGMSLKEIKAEFSRSLNEGMHGLCFSPYLEGQNIGDQLSEEQIKRRMDVIKPYTNWVRSFSCTEGNEFIPKIARDRGLKTMVGAWIGNDKDQNNMEIQALIDLAKLGMVDIAVVGNEVLLRNELSEEEVLQYIRAVKKALPNVPVAYVDAYYQFHERPQLVEACDLVLVNCYPFWEGASIDEASLYLKQMHAVSQVAAKGKPVIITETGWPNKGTNTKDAEPSETNAMKYFININEWARQENVGMFYFSSFDESWKVHHEGDVGERWGIWDKNEKLKY